MPSFRDLPPELRLRVYHHLWDGDHIFMPQIFAADPTHPASLLQVCQEIRDEASPVWYGGTHMKWSLDPRGLVQQALRWLEGLGDQNVRELREVTFWYQCGMVYELTVDLGAVKAKVSFANWTRKYEDKGREQMGRVVRKIIRKHRGGGKGMGVEGWKRIVLYLDGVLRDHHASRR